MEQSIDRRPEVIVEDDTGAEPGGTQYPATTLPTRSARPG